MEEKNKVGTNTLTLVLIGIAAMVGYAKFGPIALIILGVILILMESR